MIDYVKKLAIAAILSAISAPTVLAQAATVHPCSDSTYVALKRRPVDSLSAREYEMFRERDRACLNAPDRTSQPTEAGSSADDGLTLLAAGQADGRAAAQLHGTGRWTGGGYASGLALGLVGTAVIYMVAANRESAPTAVEITSITGKAPLYIEGFNDAYKSNLHSRRKKSALAGGLLGTATIVLIVLGAQGGS